ncbi:MAG: glycosyltransferase family 2 protein [Bacteroidales bacterium]|nr:glycosyltransferase family 2 protein [Bacteroidales bacterium]
MKVDILLSTFNGANYLTELLQSLRSQTYPDWKLIVRDDGSTDNTLDILKAFGEKERVTLLKDGIRLGPKKSFELLLEKSTADYMLFCDQDDVWLPEKIQHTLEKMQKMEQQFPEQPMLVFSDLVVSDEALNEIHPSLWNYTKVNPENIHNIYKLLVNNPVVGCTTMINRQAKHVVLPIPDEAVMHDWWVALKVSSKGKAVFLREPTIRYRLHTENNLGVSAADSRFYLKRMIRFQTLLSQNNHAIKMMKALDCNLSVPKFLFYKVMMSFSKAFR